MICQQCQKNVANVHFTKVLNGNKVEMHLCEKCAKENSQISFMPSLSIHDFFSGILGGAGSYVMQEERKPLACGDCGMTYEEFQKTGRFGCPECYKVYGEKLQPLLRRLHGGVEHRGKVPSKVQACLKTSKEIEALKEQLSAAIRNEEYEQAAELRDRIRKIETDTVDNH